MGITAGVAWNLLSLWSLAQLLKAWLGPTPSRPRVIGWLLVKIPLLYALAFVLVSHPSISPLGFGLGFTASLALVLIGYLLKRRLAHGR